MSKILINNTASPIIIADVGKTIPLGSYTIPPQEYPDWAGSSETVTQIGNAAITVNDGSSNLSISDGIDLIKGIFPSHPLVQDVNVLTAPPVSVTVPPLTVNFPATQDVNIVSQPPIDIATMPPISVTLPPINFPATQNVNIVSQPATQNVNVLNDQSFNQNYRAIWSDSSITLPENTQPHHVIYNRTGTGLLESIVLQYNSDDISIEIEIDGTIIASLDAEHLEEIGEEEDDAFNNSLPIYWTKKRKFVFKPSRPIKYLTSIEIRTRSLDDSDERKLKRSLITVVEN